MTAAAQTEAPPPKQWTLELGYHVSSFHYDESAISISYDGLLHGPTVALVGHFAPSRLMLAFEGGVSFAAVHYNGRTQAGAPVQGDGHDVLAEVRALVGIDAAASGARLTPFSGLGYSYLHDSLDAKGAYRRDVHHVYVPFGLDLAFGSSSWRGSVRGEADFLLAGRVESHLDDVSPLLPSVENTQGLGTGYAVRASVRVMRAFDGYALGVEPYLVHWNVVESEATTVTAAGRTVRLVEPDNTTTLAGVRLLVEL